MRLPGGGGLSTNTICLGREVGVVNVPLKATSSDLNRCPKKRNIIKRTKSSGCKDPDSGVESGGKPGGEWVIETHEGEYTLKSEVQRRGIYAGVRGGKTRWTSRARVTERGVM
jgi:hypothetical protein